MSSAGILQHVALFVDIPDVLLYHILSFVAPPTDRAAVVCLQISPLCRATRHSVNEERNVLRSTILHEEYEGEGENCSSKSSTRRSSTNNRSRNEGGGGGRSKKRGLGEHSMTTRRASKRFRRSAKEDVRDAHRLLCDRTEIAHFALTEMAHSHSNRTSLSLKRLRWIFKEYGPILQVNRRVDIGGTFLVECTRARHVTEKVILHCVKELIEHHGALPDISTTPHGRNITTRQSQNTSQMNTIISSQSSTAASHFWNSPGITPLCVAAARGMPTVVKYLVQTAHASPYIRGTARFRLFTNPSKSVHGTFTPLEFAQTMKEAEIRAGATEADLKSLHSCIRILTSAEKDEKRTL